VDGLHVEGVAEHEGDALRLAQIRQPVPAEQALTGNDQAVAVGRDRLEKGTRLGGQLLVQDDGAGLVENAQVHCPGVQIDAAIECVSLVVETHHGLLRMGPGA
jgi:hypothetical protein